VFVAVYQKTLSLMYVDELLGLVRDAFTESYSPSCYSYEAFGGKFSKILRDCEARADAARRNAAVAQVGARGCGCTTGSSSVR
jgi:signal recognition particle receptor subunit alpha